MKILLTSDWHIDAVTAGIPRLDEFEAYLQAMEWACVDEGVDVVCFLGDAFDPGHRLGPRYTSTLINAAVRLDEAARVGSVFIAGNHDVVETSEVTTTLTPLAEFVRYNPRMRVCETPRAFRIGNVGILALPYMSRAADTDPERWTLAFEDAEEFGSSKVPLIVIGHLTVPEALMGSESKEMARGRDVAFPFAPVSRLSPALVANGHYHKAQHVDAPSSVTVLIPGSPHRLTFGERDDLDKGFLIAEVGP